MNKQDKKNMIFFGLGTIGRDMFYALEANALIYYLSNVLHLPINIYVATSLVFTVLRVFDALNDPLMGLIVDNGRWKKSKFKPPMLIGALVGAVFYMILFTDFSLRDYRFVVVFAIAYLLWDIFYGLNDIAYWSMLPALSIDQKVREKIGAFARICANIGMFAIMVAWQPLTTALGGDSAAWFKVALGVTIAMIGFQLFTIFGVKEKTYIEEEKTSFKDLWKVLIRNDQLMWTALSMSLFTIGYITTTSISIYYMQYVYGNADMYAVLALVVGVAQIFALSIFPLFSKRMSRKKLYGISTAIVVFGYALFFIAGKSLVLIIIAALFLFIGEAFIQLLMLMFLADTVEYGQWKLGKRNESITFSIQPLINKIGGAIGMGLVSLAIVLSGIKVEDQAATSIGESGQNIIRSFMIFIPLIFIVLGYVIYIKKYKIHEEEYAKIVRDLQERGELEVDKS